jgi:demethylmacrocin O-methyltransferase
LDARLLAAAERAGAEVAAWLAGEDADRVAAFVLDEIAARSELIAGPAIPVTVQFDLAAPGGRLGYLLHLGGGPGRPKVEPGWRDEPWVTVRQDLAELVRLVHGPANGPTATREIVMREEPDPRRMRADDPWLIERPAATLAAHQVVAACGPARWDLTELAVRFGSDKWGEHWYTQHYDRHFAPWRDRRLRMLEIGIGGYEDASGGGSSLLMWKHYFRRGLIWGLDVFDKSGHRQSRVDTVRGSQNDEALLRELAGRIGPLDIVIDDGSHLNADVITSFRTLFPLLAPGGLYVVEDLQTAYWPGWGGNDTDLSDPATSMGFLNQLLDGLNHGEIGGGRRDPAPTDRTVAGVHFYHNLVFVEKGANTEASAPSWIPRDVNPNATA